MPSSYQAPKRGDQARDRTMSQSSATNLANATATVQSIIANKGDIFAIRPQDTIGKAVEVLRDKRIGALVVTDANGTLQGILSERDIVRKLAVATELPPIGDISHFIDGYDVCEPIFILE